MRRPRAAAGTGLPPSPPNPLPMKAAEIQALLSADEALVLFSVVDKQRYVIAVTRERFGWKPLPLGEEALSQQVAAFRRGPRRSGALAKVNCCDAARPRARSCRKSRPIVPSESLCSNQMPLDQFPRCSMRLSHIRRGPRNKPNITGSAWQAQRSSVLGRRTGAGRLLSTTVTATEARFAAFARSRYAGSRRFFGARDRYTQRCLWRR